MPLSKKYLLICDYCKKEYEVSRTAFNSANYRKSHFHYRHFCSTSCQLSARGTSEVTEIPCAHCGKLFKPKGHPKKDAKSKRRFCSCSCAASYNNTHKTTGSTRSKLEKWLEEKLLNLYPSLNFQFNDKSAIQSELDIYIPSLKLAFELNGIYHYEPIHGQEKLNQIQNNDLNKFQSCAHSGISLCIIDTSGQIYVTEKTSQKYLDIITSIINENLSSFPRTRT